MEQEVNNNKFSLSLWLPCLWVLLSVSRIGSGWDLSYVDPTPYPDVLGGSLLLRSGYMLLMAAGGCLLFKRRLPWRDIIKENIWVFLLFGYMGLSVLWSDFPQVAFKRWVKAVGMLIMILVLYSSKSDLRQTFHRFFNLTFTLILCSSLVVILFFPMYGISVHPHDNDALSWVGITMHKNGLGQIAMISAAYYLWYIINSKVKVAFFPEKFLLIIAIVLLIGTKSMTSLVIFVAASGLIIGVHYLKWTAAYFFWTMPYLVVMGLLSLATLHFVFFEGELLAGLLDLLGRDTTLTGRVDLWQDVLAYAWERPLLGHGFGSFWVGDLAHDLWLKYIWQPNQAHNGYIDTFVTLGLFGLILLGVLIIRSFYNITRMLPGSYSFTMMRIYLLGMIVFHNLAESSFCRMNHFLWFLFLLVVIQYPVTKVRYYAEKPH